MSAISTIWKYKKVTKNLAALNAVYEMELKDADSHVKNMNKFYESLTAAMNGLSKVSANSEKFNSVLSILTDKLVKANNVFSTLFADIRRTKD